MCNSFIRNLRFFSVRCRSLSRALHQDRCNLSFSLLCLAWQSQDSHAVSRQRRRMVCITMRCIRTSPSKGRRHAQAMVRKKRVIPPGSSTPSRPPAVAAASRWTYVDLRPPKMRIHRAGLLINWSDSGQAARRYRCGDARGFSASSRTPPHETQHELGPSLPDGPCREFLPTAWRPHEAQDGAFGFFPVGANRRNIQNPFLNLCRVRSALRSDLFTQT